jgi:TonB family protein
MQGRRIDMTERSNRIGDFLRNHGLALGAGGVLMLGGVFVAHWIASSRNAPPPRKMIQITAVRLQPQPQVKPPPPPLQPVVQPKVVDQQPTNRVDIKQVDIPPPDAPPPSSAPSAGGGRLALAAEGEGPGDAFNLVGNVNGRGLLSGGGLGDGTGDGDGLGGGDGSARFGWYYARIASDIEEAFRKQKKLNSASARVELRIWADEGGRINRVQLLKSTGNADLDEALRSIVGLRLKQPPPQDIPMPMIARFTARRPG